MSVLNVKVIYHDGREELLTFDSFCDYASFCQITYGIKDTLIMGYLLHGECDETD